MFTFCPNCASRNIAFLERKVFRCPDCGFEFYHNTAAACGCIIESDGRILILVRDAEPQKGKLDLPGGFIEPNEGILEGLYREIQEETGWTPFIPPGKTLTDIFTFFTSFSNVYLYKNIPYNTCDLYFRLNVPGLREQDLIPQQGEIAAIHFIKPQDIDLDAIAFASTRQAVERYLQKYSIQGS